MERIKYHLIEALQERKLDREALFNSDYFKIALKFRFYSKTHEEGEPHTVKPDFDNLSKLTCDSCNTTLWKDDCKASSATVEKVWTQKEDLEGVLITIEGFKLSEWMYQ